MMASTTVFKRQEVTVKRLHETLVRPSVCPSARRPISGVDVPSAYTAGQYHVPALGLEAHKIVENGHMLVHLPRVAHVGIDGDEIVGPRELLRTAFR
jgi:hypothetical protein